MPPAGPAETALKLERAPRQVREDGCERGANLPRTPSEVRDAGVGEGTTPLRGGAPSLRGGRPERGVAVAGVHEAPVPVAPSRSAARAPRASQESSERAPRNPCDQHADWCIVA